MNQKEATNIILELRKKGWSEAEISCFITVIETHVPTEQEVQESNEKALKNEKRRK